jgi:seryl-tRNA synthetase
MIDIRLIRENPDLLKQTVDSRCVEIDVDKLVGLDSERRSLIAETEKLAAEKKKVSQLIGTKMKAGEKADMEKQQVNELKTRINKKDDQLKSAVDLFDSMVLAIPNIPHETTPIGKGETDNQILDQTGGIPAFAFTPKPHWEIGENLNILDTTRAVKTSGSGFYALRGPGAKLERALINWFLDVHVNEYGYTEVMPPHVVNSATMTGTGQLPKMADDMYRIQDEDLWLIPTAEVPVTNLYRDEILAVGQLPVYHCAWTPCFRREAGSYGKEVRGITRVHQFNKVEMVKFVRPETSYDELESLRGQAESLLQRLGLTYRTVLLCTVDISFAAAKCYDLEVWAPGMDTWLEVSSCSNFEAFQARRANIRYRPEADAGPQFLHTLNGSGLALPRTVIAILENYQQADGSVAVPEVLQPYMQCKVIR